MAYSTLYAWEDLDACAATGKPEQKLGDHFSECNTWAEAELEVRSYIRNSLGRQKHKFDQGRIVIHKIWDVSDYAKSINRFGKHQKIDDAIRHVVGNHVQADVHQIDADTLIIRVNKELSKKHQLLPAVGLTAWQATVAEDMITSIDNGDRTILGSLAARFGKTIFSGVMTVETGRPLTIIVSYVLTSFTSFEKDLTSFTQFKDLVLVDTSNPEYQYTINNALENNCQVVAFLSMCMGSNRQKKIDFLFNQNYSRLVLVDEADFGVHKINQSKLLIDARKTDDVIILMTGTNADKAASNWNVEKMFSVVYPEMLMEKKNPKPVYSTTLTHFKIDSARHELVVDIQFYQIGLQSLLDLLKITDPQSFVDDGIYLASWSKTAANFIKAKGFFTKMLESVFLGQHGLDALNVEYQIGQVSDHRVALMFLPGSTTNAQLTDATIIARQAVPGFLVMPIYGEDTSNRSAERDVHAAIETAKQNGQSVLLLSAGMAQRSFSVAAITELYLAYDNGDNGATIQKMSRVLTPDQAGKIGRIISLSFDPNRDDKFDSMLIETALNYKKSRQLTSAKAALRDVIRTVDIFRCTEDGAIKLHVDEYLAAAIARKSIARVVGKIADLSSMSAEQLEALASGNVAVFRAAQKQAAEKGKTRPSKVTIPSSKPTGRKIVGTSMAKVREMIVTIVENIDILIYGSGTASLYDALEMVSNDVAMRSAVEAEFGIDFDIIVELFNSVICTDMVELQVDH